MKKESMAWKKFLIIVFALIVIFALSGVFSAFAFIGPPGNPPQNNNVLQTTTSRAFVIATTTVISAQPQLIFQTTGNPGDIIFSPTGNIGVGTEAPDEKLHVSGNLKIAGDSTISGTLTAGTLGGSLNAGYVSAGVFGLNSTKGNYTFQASGNSNPILFIDAANERVGIATSGPGYSLDVLGQAHLRGTSTPNGVGLLVHSSGNVGIGTTTPAYKLEVLGTAHLRGSVSGTGLFVDSSGRVGIGTTNLSAALSIQSSATDYTVLSLTNTDNSSRQWGVLVGGLSGGAYVPAKGFAIADFTGTVSRFVIDTSGNVGINDLSPDYTLDVTGTGRFTQPVIVGAPTLVTHAATKSYVDSAFAGGLTVGNLAQLTVTGTSTLGDVTIIGSFDGVLKASSGTVAGSATTDDLTEGDNLYFTDARSRAALSGTSPISFSTTTGVISLGTVSVGSGGTGATSLTGILKGNGTSAFTGVTGAANYLTKWSDANTLGTSTLYESSGSIGIGTTTPQAAFHSGSSYSAISGITPFGILGVNSNSISSVHLENANSGTSAEVRFIAKADDSNYLAFTVPSSANTGTFFGATKSTGNFIFSNGRPLYVGTIGAHDILFGRSNSTISAVIKGDSGNVGIGTTTPSNPLVINAPAGDNNSDIPLFFIRNTSATNAPASSAVNLAKTTGNMADGFGSRILFATQDDTAGGFTNWIGAFGAVRNGADNSGALIFQTASAGTLSEKVRIAYDGKVGIGTTTPSYTLDVVGTAQFSQPVIVGTPTAASHATTKSYVDSAFTGGSATGTLAQLTVTGTTTLNGITILTGYSGVLKASGGTVLGGATTDDLTEGDNLYFTDARSRAALSGTSPISFSTTTGVISLGTVSVGSGGTGATSLTGILKGNGTSAFTGVTGAANYLTKWSDANTLGTSTLYESSGSIGIGTTTPANKLYVYNSGSSYASVFENSNSSNSTIVTRFISRSTVAVESFGMLVGFRDTNTVGAGNGFHFSLKDSSGAETEYGGIGVGIESNTNGSEKGFITLQTTDNGSTRSNKVRITSDGKVGIGTTTPSYTLDVVGTAQFSQPVIVGTPTAASHAATKSYVDSAFTGGSATGTLASLQVIGTTTLATTAGRVGIGTTTPQYPVSINFPNGYNFSDYIVDIHNEDTTNGQGHGLRVTAGNNSASDSSFIVRNRSLTTLFYVESTGKVGIGDSGPDQALEVMSGGTSATQITVSNTNSGDADAQIGFELADGTNTFTLGLDDSDSDKFKISTTALGTNDRLVIDSSGNIAIASSSPAAKLDISGTADSTQLIVRASSTQSNTNPLVQLRNAANSVISAWHSDNAANLFLGANAGRVNDVSGAGNEGLRNTFIGANAGYSNTTGYYNTLLGNSALYSNTAGISNVAVGDQAGYFTTGSSNTLLGYGAGNTLTSGSNNIIIGAANEATSDVGDYQLDIGDLIYGDIDDGRVGINVVPDTYALQVQGTGYFSQPVIVGTPTQDTHAATRSYVDSAVADVGDARWILSGSTVHTSSTSWFVGIGTTTPQSKLAVVNDNVSLQSAQVSIENNGGGGHDILLIDTDNSDSSAYALKIITTSTVRLVVTNSGSIGIGTTTPTGDLNVGGVLPSLTSSLFNSASINVIGVGGKSIGWLYSQGAVSASLILDDSGGTADQRVIELINASGVTKFRLVEDDAGIARDNMLVLSHSTGNIGIASSTPGYGLTVVGTGYFSQPVVVGTPTGSTHAATKSYVDSAISWSKSSNDIYSNVSGNVGIGSTVTTPSAKLEIDGGVRLNTVSSKPTCSSDQRGTIWYVQNTTGLQDALQVCAKDATDLYDWRTIY